MRWVVLGVTAGLICSLVYAMARPPEAAPLDHPEQKESNEKFPDGTQDKPKADKGKRDKKKSARPVSDKQHKPEKEGLDPIAVLEECLRRYAKEVKGYECILAKQERIDGRLQKEEVIWVAFQEKPFSVYFQWLKGARKAERALYVEGENDGKMLARPSGFIARRIVGDVAERDVDGADARHAGRYTLAQFGLKQGTERSLATWKKLRAQDALKVESLGLYTVPDTGNRLCYKYHAHYAEAVDDGVTDLTLYIDKETWLQVGSVLKGKDGLIASYFFRDIKLNATFKKDQFKRAALIP